MYQVPHCNYASKLSRRKYSDKVSKILHALCLTVSLVLKKLTISTNKTSIYHSTNFNQIFDRLTELSRSVIWKRFVSTLLLWLLLPLEVISLSVCFFCLLTSCFIIVFPFIWKTFNVINFEAQPTSCAYELYMIKSCAYVLIKAEMI